MRDRSDAPLQIIGSGNSDYPLRLPGLTAAARPCYISVITRLLEEAVATVASLPDEQQDEFARILLQLAGHEQPVYVLTPEEEADLDASITAEQCGDFATDEEMLAIRAKYAR